LGDGGFAAAPHHEATKTALASAQRWLLGHSGQLMADTALVLGAYLTIGALVRLT
jgi:hypothetical protein